MAKPFSFIYNFKPVAQALHAETLEESMLEKDPQFEEKLKHNAHLVLFEFANERSDES